MRFWSLTAAVFLAPSCCVVAQEAGPVAAPSPVPAAAPQDSEPAAPPKSPAGEEPMPPPPAAKPEEPSPPTAKPPAEGAVAPSEGTPPAPAPAPPPKTSADALALIEKAARAQGTWDLRGQKAVKRIEIGFKDVAINDPKFEGGGAEAVLRIALPAAGAGASRFYSATTFQGETTILGHSGRVAWTWTKSRGKRPLENPDEHAADLREVDERRRMLRMALRVFLLGNLAEGPEVTLGPDETLTIPVGKFGDTRKVACRRLDRAADPDSGEPPLRLYLDAKDLRPVAAILPAADPKKDPAFILTLDFDPAMKQPSPSPEGVKVPNWVELFEVPPKEGAKPVVRIQARVASVVIDPPTKIPDDAFEPAAAAAEKR